MSNSHSHNCKFVTEIRPNIFQCECGRTQDVTAPVYDSHTASSASPVERGRKQKI